VVEAAQGGVFVPTDDARALADAVAKQYDHPEERAALGGSMCKYVVERLLKVSRVLLPAKWRFRNIMSFHDGWARQFYGRHWTAELRRKYIEFLLARRINLASMYGDTDFSYKEIEQGVAAGKIPYCFIPFRTMPGWPSRRRSRLGFPTMS
jgi:hypothetical protein